MRVTNFHSRLRMIVCLLVCLACASHGQRADRSASDSQCRPSLTSERPKVKPVKALATLLRAYDDPAAFNPSGVRGRVFYALTELEEEKQNKLKGRIGAELRQQQLLLSVQSLRMHDQWIPVHVITYGTPLPVEFATQLSELGVEVIYAGSYFEALENVLPGSGPFLEAYPVLAKFLALPYLADRPAQSMLYVDTDTVFLGPPDKLFAECTEADFYAREEAQCERSHEKTNIFQCDDTLCRAVQEGLSIAKPCLPFNTGVILYNNMSWLRLLPLLEFFLTLLLSFCNFLIQNFPVERFPDKQLQYCKDHRADLALLVDGSAITYPALNLWTREQFAALVTFAIGNLEQRDFRYEQVLQGTEELIFPNPPRPIISHYWSPETHEFCKSVAPRRYPELNVDALRIASQAQENDPECGGAAKDVKSEVPERFTSAHDNRLPDNMPRENVGAQFDSAFEDARREEMEDSEVESESGWMSPLFSSEAPEASQTGKVDSQSGWAATGASSQVPRRQQDASLDISRETLEGRVKVVFINLKRRPHRRQQCEKLLHELGLANVSERFEAFDGQELFDNGLLGAKCQGAVTENAFSGELSRLESGFVLGGHFTPGGVGLCASTQLLLQQHRAQNPSLPLLVLEDDVRLAPGAKKTAVRDLLDYLFPPESMASTATDASTAQARAVKWDILLLGSHHKPQIVLQELEEVASLPAELGGSFKRVLDFAGLFGYVVRDGAAAGRILSEVFPCPEQLDNAYSRGIDTGGVTILHLGIPLLASSTSMPGSTDIQRIDLEAFTQYKEEMLIKQGHISPAGIDGIEDPQLRETVIQKIGEAWQKQFGGESSP